MPNPSRAHKPKRTNKEVRASIGGGRTLLSVIGKIADEVNDDQKMAALNKPESASIIAQMAALALGTTAETVAPAMSLQFQLLALLISIGRFVSYVHSDITAQNFPFTAADLVGLFERAMCIKLVTIAHLDHDPETDEVLRIIDQRGLRPATLLELLVWWLLNPDQWKNCLVVALGSLWHGYVPCVNGGGGSRELLLRTVAGTWLRGYTFAAVSKVPSK